MAQVIWMATTKAMFTNGQPRVIVGIENDRHCVWRKRPWVTIHMDPAIYDPPYVAPRSPIETSMEIMRTMAEQRIAMSIVKPRSNFLDIIVS